MYAGILFFPLSFVNDFERKHLGVWGMCIFMYNAYICACVHACRAQSAQYIQRREQVPALLWTKNPPRTPFMSIRSPQHNIDASDWNSAGVGVAVSTVLFWCADADCCWELYMFMHLCWTYVSCAHTLVWCLCRFKRTEQYSRALSGDVIAHLVTIDASYANWHHHIIILMRIVYYYYYYYSFSFFFSLFFFSSFIYLVVLIISSFVLFFSHHIFF